MKNKKNNVTKLAMVMTLLLSVSLLATNLSDNFTTDTYASAWTRRAGATPVGAVDVVNGEFDVDLSTPRWGLQYNTSPGSNDHEVQVTWQVGTSSSHVGVGGPCVGMRNDATTEWYYIEDYNRDATEIQVKRKNSDGSATQIGTSQNFDQADGTWTTIRMARDGNDIDVWLQNDASKPPTDPGWIGSDGSPTFTITDSTYTGATYSYVGLCGHTSGSDYDTRHDYWKARALSDRGGGGGSPVQQRMLLMGVGEGY